MKFVFDNMLSHRFAKALQQVNREVVALRESFPEDSADEEVLSGLANTSSVLVTVDRRIRTRPWEREALTRSGVIALFIAPFFSKLQFWDQFVWLVRHWQGIEDTARGL